MVSKVNYCIVIYPDSYKALRTPKAYAHLNNKRNFKRGLTERAVPGRWNDSFCSAGGPTANPTWPPVSSNMACWKMDHLSVIFLLKPPFMGVFQPAMFDYQRSGADSSSDDSFFFDDPKVNKIQECRVIM